MRLIVCLPAGYAGTTFTTIQYKADGRPGKKHFFVNSEILGIQIWRKKLVNYDKFEIATRQRK